MSTNRIELSHLDSPIGELLLGIGEGGLVCLELDGNETVVRSRLARTHPDASITAGKRGKDILARVRGYFAGDLQALDAIPVAPVGTPFQLEVWDALRMIPAGETRSYLEIAIAVGRPAAVRAVGAANGQNPIAIVVPCHRVIASDGSLHGYGGGLARKAWLLRHEGALPRELPLVSGAT